LAGENSRKEESHNLRKEAEAKIDYLCVNLILLNEINIDKQRFEEHARPTVNETLIIFVNNTCL